MFSGTTSNPEVIVPLLVPQLLTLLAVLVLRVHACNSYFNIIQISKIRKRMLEKSIFPEDNLEDTIDNFDSFLFSLHFSCVSHIDLGCLTVKKNSINI